MFPQCPFYPQFHGEAAWLVQAVHCNSNYCKLLFIGVKESVNAVTARAIRGDTLECGAERFQPARDQAIRRGYKALSGPYGVGSVYYPGPVSYTHLDVYKRQSLLELVQVVS